MASPMTLDRFSHLEDRIGELEQRADRLERWANLVYGARGGWVPELDPANPVNPVQEAGPYIGFDGKNWTWSDIHPLGTPGRYRARLEQPKEA